MHWKHSGFRSILVVLMFGVLSACAQNVPPPSDFIQGSKVMTGTGNLLHTTLREDCRSIVFDARGRVWTVGIQSDGSEELNATRQFLSIGLFEDAHWTPTARITASGYVFFPAVAPDEKGGFWLSWTQFNDKLRN